MLVEEPAADPKRYSYFPEPYLILVTALYTISATVSSSDFYLYWKQICEPFIPFGECLVGVYESQHLVYSRTSVLQYLISFAIVLLAGTWSDSHGRRRKPLIILPIIAQILTDGLYFIHGYWYWPSYIDNIFKWVLPSLYFGRNLFWVGVMSYVSENSTVESRTLKHGIIIATYPISSLMGAGIVALFKMTIRYDDYYLVILIPILLNLVGLMVVNLHVKDTSDAFNKYFVWNKPYNVLKELTDVFKTHSKRVLSVLAVLITCQSMLVTRIGCDYDLVMEYIKMSFGWRYNEEVFFTVLKKMAICFGAVVLVYVLSYYKKINELRICISACRYYIIAGIFYNFFNQFLSLTMITVIYLCHGTVITIISSLTSKLVEIEQLGRLNAIQTCINSLLTIGIVKAYQFKFSYIIYTDYGNFYLVIFLYIILTLPILYTFKIIYYRFNDLWQKDTAETQQDIFIINQ